MKEERGSEWVDFVLTYLHMTYNFKSTNKSTIKPLYMSAFVLLYKKLFAQNVFLHLKMCKMLQTMGVQWSNVSIKYTFP